MSCLTSASVSHSVVSNSLQTHGLYSPWNSPGQDTRVGSGSFLQGIIPTQGSNSGLPHSRQILYQLNHQGSPRKLEWVAYSFLADLPKPGFKLGSPALQVDSLPAEPQGNPKNTSGVAIHSLVDLPNLGIEPGSPALQADS